MVRAPEPTVEVVPEGPELPQHHPPPVAEVLQELARLVCGAAVAEVLEHAGGLGLVELPVPVHVVELEETLQVRALVRSARLGGAAARAGMGEGGGGGGSRVRRSEPANFFW